MIMNHITIKYNKEKFKEFLFYNNLDFNSKSYKDKKSYKNLIYILNSSYKKYFGDKKC